MAVKVIDRVIEKSEAYQSHQRVRGCVISER